MSQHGCRKGEDSWEPGHRFHPSYPEGKEPDALPKGFAHPNVATPGPGPTSGQFGRDEGHGDKISEGGNGEIEDRSQTKFG